MRVVIAINMSRANADRTNGQAIANSVTNALRRDGVSIQDTPVFQNNALNQSILESRSVIKVGVVIRGDTIDRNVTRLITAACCNAILHSAGLLNFSPQAIAALPPDGSGDGYVGRWSGPVGLVTREISAGNEAPTLQTSNTVFSSTVTQTTVPGIRPGTTVPSGLATVASDTASTLGDYKVPIFIGLGVVGLAAVGYAIRSVR